LVRRLRGATSPARVRARGRRLGPGARRRDAAGRGPSGAVRGRRQRRRARRRSARDPHGLRERPADGRARRRERRPAPARRRAAAVRHGLPDPLHQPGEEGRPRAARDGRRHAARQNLDRPPGRPGQGADLPVDPGDRALGAADRLGALPLATSGRADTIDPRTDRRSGPTAQMTEAPSPSDSLDPLAAFEAERGRLFGIAYRMLGSVSEAEDVLQDAWIRWQAVDPATVESPPGFLVRMVTRLCIDTLGAARNRLTDYVGPWLPEPIVRQLGDPPAADPAALSEQADDLSIAFLLLLERLTAVERAVFLLRESFDFSYREIAGIVGKSEAACRQIESRARRRLDAEGRPAPADPVEHDR